MIKDAMTKNKSVNPIFPPDDNQMEVFKPIMSNTEPATYNEKVMIHDWQMNTLAEPRDNVDFFPPNGNLHKSSYRRLGPNSNETFVSETHAMLLQINTKDQYISICPRRSMLHLYSFTLTDSTKWYKDLKITDVKLHPYNNGCTDYCTTTKHDFQPHYPMKPPPPPPRDDPWLLNRRTLGYNLHELCKRDGTYKFLDDNMELHDKIAVLKMHRFTSYDPVLKRYTDTCKHAETRLKK